MTQPRAGGSCAALFLLVGCLGSVAVETPVPVLRYVGSSTIGQFLRDADAVYGDARLLLDTEPESAGGESAILEGRADLAGVAMRVQPETLAAGVQATLIGRDVIAVIVHPDNPIDGLTTEQLQDIFAGDVQNWSELGGPEQMIRPYIVGPESATRRVFRAKILGERDYRRCEVVRPDSALPAKVAGDQGAIGCISCAFLSASCPAKILAVDGQRPDPTNVQYPIARPLHLLWWPGRDRVRKLVEWLRTPAAQTLLLKRFARAEQTSEPAEGGQ